jgi:mgtE-like transporter
MILIPPSIALRGYVYGSLGSRLGTFLHTGKIKPKFEINHVVIHSLIASFLLLLILSLANGVISAKISPLFGIQSLSFDMLLDLVVVSVLSAFFSSAIMIPSTIGIAIGSYRFGLDPDNVTSPLITVLGDIVTLPLIFVCVDIAFMFGLGVKIAILSFFALSTVLLYMKCKNLCRRIVKESLPILTFCIAFDLIAGATLGKEIESFTTTPGLLTVIPAILAISGSIGGIIVARFSTILHLGYLKPKALPDVEISRFIGLMFILNTVSFTFLGIIGYVVNHVLGIQTPHILYLLSVSVLSGFLLMVVISFVSYYISVISFKMGFDPDNIGIPVITSVIDMSGAICFVAVLRVLEVF